MYLMIVKMGMTLRMGDESDDEEEAKEDLPCMAGNHALNVEYDLEDPSR